MIGQNQNATVIIRKSVIACALIAAIGVTSGCAKPKVYGHLSNGDKAANFNAELGTNYLAVGELEAAELKLTRALEQNPNNALANNSYAKLRAALDDPAAADSAFRKSIQLDPKRAEYRNNYAIFLCGRGQTAEAMRQFVTAAENKFYRTPEFALDNAAVCAMDANDFATADKHLRDAIRINPAFAPSMLHMAELKHKTGDLQLADAYFSRYTGMARHTPISLAVGIDIKRAVGDQAAVTELTQVLMANFPSSSQAKRLASN